MSDRQYGGSRYRENNRPGNVNQTSTTGAYNTSQSRQFPEYPSPSKASPVRSPPRKPIQGQSNSFDAPPPPPHRKTPSTPSRYRNQPSTPQGQTSYGNVAGVGVFGDDEADPYGQPYRDERHALRDIDNHYGSRTMSPSPDFGSDLSQATTARSQRPMHQYKYSSSSAAPLSSNAANIAGDSPSPPRTNRNALPAPGMLAYGYGYDQDMPRGPSGRSDGYDAFVDPHDIDDADDGFEEQAHSRRNHFGLGAGAAAGAGTVPGLLKAFGSRNTSGNYGHVPGGGGPDPEKSEWLKARTSGNKKLKYIFGGLGVLVIIGIIAGVVGGIVATNPGSDGSSSSSSSDPSGKDYDINSPEVQALLNNKNLHKVFPGMDYTPLNAQYPACLTVPPNQDNVTLDVAMMSQLAPTVRLYGTDCNQTQLVLNAIENLKMTDSIKVWLGVWIENNSTTNNRQLDQMYDILDQYPQDRFAGVIVGNEVLFRQDLTETQLADIVKGVQTKLSAKGIKLPVSTSDIGSEWTAALAEVSDIVMANVHPFFAGVKPQAAPQWVWNFFDESNVPLAHSNDGGYPKAIISETGWPSQGGNDCGTGKKCPTPTDGSIAGISELNEYMAGFVCQSMEKKITYFWFEATDQPWAAIFDTPSTGDYWEPHWGLLDVNRNLKDGVVIPDCGGKTIDSPY